MHWEIKHGATYRQFLKENRPIPKYMRPVVNKESVDFFVSVFFELLNDCPIGLDVGPIPSKSIREASKHYGFKSLESYEYFRFSVRTLEREYFKLTRKKDKEADRWVINETPMTKELFEAKFQGKR